MIRLDIDQLQTFVKIVETASFTKAAESVHRTQSAVSMQIRRLEERLETRLFVRDGRKVRLTADGQKLLGYARRIVKLHDETLHALTGPDLAGEVRFGTPDDYAVRFLPDILARFRESNPRVEVVVECAPTFHLQQMLSNGELDIAIVTHVEKNTVQDRIVRREPLLWVAPECCDAHLETPLPLALGRPMCEWRNAAEEALNAMKREHRILYVSWNASVVSAAVQAGLAISVLPESALQPGMRVLNVNDGFPSLPAVDIAIQRGTTGHAALIDALENHIVTALDNISLRVLDDDATSISAVAAQ